jgi:hypothetical protein
MASTRPDGALALEVLTTGPNAHGYGQLPDSRNFAFRVRNRKARLEIYRAEADAVEPVPSDVELVAESSTGKLNLDSPRSLTVLLRHLMVDAEPEHEHQERTLRAYFVRLDSILDDWADAVAEPVAADPGAHTLRSRLSRLFTDAA